MEKSNFSLTNDEIEKLFDFVQKKRVLHVDVQLEIVDHLASAIEDLRADEPILPFDKALLKIYSNFPITGFYSFVQSRQKALEKYWIKKLGSHLLSYFKIPRIIFTVLLWLSFTMLILNTNTKTYYFLIVCCSIIAIGTGARFYWKFFHKMRKDKRYMVLDTYAHALYTFLMAVICIPVYQFDFLSVVESDPSQISKVFLYFLGFIPAIMGIILHAFAYVFPDVLKEEINKNYGHLQVSI